MMWQQHRECDTFSLSFHLIRVCSCTIKSMTPWLQLAYHFLYSSNRRQHSELLLPLRLFSLSPHHLSVSRTRLQRCIVRWKCKRCVDVVINKISIKMIMYANRSRSTSLLLLLVVINNCAPQSHCFAIEMREKKYHTNPHIVPSAHSHTFTLHKSRAAHCQQWRP